MKNIKKMSFLLMLTAFTLQGCATQSEKKEVTLSNQAATKPATPAAKPTYVPAPAPVVEQYALDRLKQMSDKLVASKAFSYRSKSAIDLQSETGQFVTFFTKAEVVLQRPNKLYANISGDLPHIQIYFDGNKASAIDVDTNTYAVSTPLANIDKMLNYLMTKARISFPSADILYSDPYTEMTKNLTDATVVGDSMVNGVPSEHFTYREPAIDWEIWIAKGKNALPMRLAMSYRQVKNHPRFLVEFTDWKLNPKLKAHMFDFKAPVNGKQIEFGTFREQKK